MKYVIIGKEKYQLKKRRKGNIQWILHLHEPQITRRKKVFLSTELYLTTYSWYSPSLWP